MPALSRPGRCRVPVAGVGSPNQSVVPGSNGSTHRARRRRLVRHGDLVGPAGYLADLSRAYIAGDAKPTVQQRRLYDDARQFLNEIMSELRPGAAFDELGERRRGRGRG
ncbi:M24 family metallopeptidase [Streptomyces cyaneus]|uniref:M24 family metallopeptidase n=1 Tax=Streptomyces cyaneus TaxID=1904 RepID=UPI003CCC69D9